MAALLAWSAPARSAVLGCSLGLALPADRLSGYAGDRGTALLPAPQLGARVALPRSFGAFAYEAELQADVAVFRSGERVGLTLFFLPVRAGAAWQAGRVEEMPMRVSVTAGPAFGAVAGGDGRSFVGATAAIGWEVRRELKDMAASIEAGLGLVWAEGVQEVLAVRLVLWSGS